MNKKLYIVLLGIFLSSIFSILYLYIKIQKSNQQILNNINITFSGHDNISDGDYSVLFIDNGKIENSDSRFYSSFDDKSYYIVNPFIGFNFMNLKKYSSANLSIGKTSEEIEILNKSKFYIDSLSLVSFTYNGQDKTRLLNSDIKGLNNKLDKICKTAYNFIIQESNSNFQSGAQERIIKFGKISDNYHYLKRSKVEKDNLTKFSIVKIGEYQLLISNDTIIYSLVRNDKKIIYDGLLFFALFNILYYVIIFIIFLLKKIIN